MKHCEIDGCTKAWYCRQWCEMHYYRWRAHGDPLTVLRHINVALETRLWGRTRLVGDCLIFTGYLNRGGYGQIGHEGRTWQVHRLAYTDRVGPIPAGLEIDHLCRMRACVNIDHLEVVTREENQRRMHEAKAS